MVCFELFYVKSLVKSQSHETRSSMELTGEGNIYDQNTRNWQHQTNIHVKWYKLDTLKNLKLHFKMLQNISLIVCIKRQLNVLWFFLHKITWMWFSMWVYVKYIVLGNHNIFYAIKMLHYFYFCHIYLPNINHHIKILVCTELQHTQLLLRCDSQC